MFHVTDLKVVTVVTPDLESAVATFRKNFGLPVTRSSDSASGPSQSVRLGIGAAEIEMATPAGDRSPLASFLAARGPGLYELVLEVDDVEAARAALADRGIDLSVTPGSDGRRAGLLSPADTHGVRIVLVAR
jgi:methylmalonyl-CoA/ethylmalonyl-CoA epimerase